MFNRDLVLKYIEDELTTCDVALTEYKSKCPVDMSVAQFVDIQNKKDKKKFLKTMQCKIDDYEFDN